MEKMSANTNALNWFEIPVTDMARAKLFYEIILDIEMTQQEMNGNEMSFFPFNMESGKVSGALVHHKDGNIKPGADGPVIYLNANPALETVADKIEAAGGKVIMPKTHISEQVGYMAFFNDTVTVWRCIPVINKFKNSTMAEYLLLFRGGESAYKDQQQSPEKWQAHMQKWMQWMGDLTGQGKFVGAQPLKLAGKVVTGNNKVVTDGPFVEGKEMVGGYLICKADTLDEAVEISKACPVLDYDGIVEVREISELKM